MKIPNDELKKMVKFRNVIFDEKMFEKEPYERKTKGNTIIFKHNDSFCVIKAYIDGRMKDFSYKGIEISKAARKKYDYHLTKTNQYVESKDFLDKKSGEMKITTIYKVYSGKRSTKWFYIACENIIMFPSLERESVVGMNRYISLPPYIWETRLYAFDMFKETMEYIPVLEDTAYFMQISERDIKIVSDAKFILESFSLNLNEKISFNIAGTSHDMKEFMYILS